MEMSSDNHGPSIVRVSSGWSTVPFAIAWTAHGRVSLRKRHTTTPRTTDRPTPLVLQGRHLDHHYKQFLGLFDTVHPGKFGGAPMGWRPGNRGRDSDEPGSHSIAADASPWLWADSGETRDDPIRQALRERPVSRHQGTRIPLACSSQDVGRPSRRAGTSWGSPVDRPRRSAEARTPILSPPRSVPPKSMVWCHRSGKDCNRAGRFR